MSDTSSEMKAASAASIRWTYTTVLNIVFAAVAIAFIWRFLRTGGAGMLHTMNRPMENMDDRPAEHRHSH